MKKTTFALIAFLFIPLYSSAMVASEYWSYEFRLEYKQGTLGVEQGVKYPYSPIPVEYLPEYKPADADFYGIIFNIKNNEDARFGFMTPTTTVVALGKSVFSVRAPKFADADHVSFYTKSNKHLFDISVKDSSFCNDNNVCDDKVGENYKNCPFDCPIPVNIPVVDQVAPTDHEPTITPTTQVVSPTNTQNTEEATSGEVIKKGNTTWSKALTPGVIMMLVGGILILVLGIILLRIRKNMD